MRYKIRDRSKDTEAREDVLKILTAENQFQISRLPDTKGERSSNLITLKIAKVKALI
jgi:hypothetical protein